MYRGNVDIYIYVPEYKLELPPVALHQHTQLLPRLAPTHQVCAPGVGCHGAECRLSWSWVWEALKAACRTQSHIIN